MHRPSLRSAPLGLIAPLLLAAALATAACETPLGEPIVAPDSPVITAQARWSDDALLVELAGPLDWPWDATTRIYVETFDRFGPIDTLTGLLQRTGEEAIARQLVWWIATRRPDEIVVEVRTDDRVVFSQRVDRIGDVPVVEAGGACDPGGSRDRCAPGALCWPYRIGWDRIGETLDPALDGTCLRGTVRGWRTDPRVAAEHQLGTFELLFEPGEEADPADEPGPDFAQVRWPEDGRSRTRMRAITRMEGERWRGILPVIDHGGGARPEAVDLYFGPHRFASGLRFSEQPAPRALADACDPARVVDICAVDTLCDGGVCVSATPPTIDGLEAVGDAQSVSVRFETHDPEADVQTYRVRLVVDGAPRRWLRRDAWGPFHQFDPGLALHYEGEIVADGPDHSVRYAFLHGLNGEPPERLQVEVEAVDSRGHVTAAIVDVQPADPTPANTDAPCDALGLEVACPADHLCDNHEGAGAFTCRDLAAACPTLTGELPAEGVVARWQGPTTPTRVYCGGYLGEPETPRESHVYRFTAPEAGEYRFDGERDGGISAIALRGHCAVQRSESSCGNTRYPVAATRLEAGASVYVIVQRPIARLVEESGWWLEPLDAYRIRVDFQPPD